MARTIAAALTIALPFALLAGAALAQRAAPYGFDALPSYTDAAEIAVHGRAPADALVHHGAELVQVEAGAFCFERTLAVGFNLVDVTLERADGTFVRWAQPVIRTLEPVAIAGPDPAPCGGARAGV